MKRQYAFCFALVTLMFSLLFSMSIVQPVNACYGPHITSEISRTQVNINESVTVWGQICPVKPNVTVRVIFTRPDYSWIDRYVPADDKTGEFTVTQTLDMAGYWNITPVYGHISDRLYANVTDPSASPLDPPLTSHVLPYRPNYSLITVSTVLLGVGVVAVVAGRKEKTRKISSLRLLVQIAFVFLIFAGVFVDHQIVPWPAEQINPHELSLSTNVLGVSMSDGLPVPVMGCYYPCGRTVTCPLWEMQAYVYPFWNAGHGWGG